jgi:WD40 repeat protein
MPFMRFRHNIAVVIGINDYQDGVQILKTPVNDAQALAEILHTQHDYKINLLLDREAKRNDLIELLEKTLPQQVGKKDRLIFYFAGHGIALNGEDGPEGYLIPQDARLGDISTYLPMRRVHDALHQLPCSHFLGVLDCCFAGSFRWSSMRKLVPVNFGILHKERFDRFIKDPAWQIITSAAHDQEALDAFNLQDCRGQVGKHSPFAAALIEALEGKADAYPPADDKAGKPAGDGVIIATELYMYLRDRVEIATQVRFVRQTPGIHPLKKHDKGEYIFLTPKHELNLPPAPPLDESKNPYRGLESFEEEHSELFFGRSELTQKLQDFVKIRPLTIVLGASGSGKSSLVKAGLIPTFKQDANEKWCILSPIRPGETPIQALNNALVKAQFAKVELQNPQKTLTQSIAVWAKRNPNSKLLIFIDQSEEIITLCPNETERQEFFQQVLTAIDDHRYKLRVVLSLRSDFEPQIRDTGLKFVPEVLNKLGHAELKRRWQRGRFIVPAMKRAELREAIEKPAEARVMYFQPHDLVEQIIEEVADMPGALPLLSFALSELFLKYLRRQREAQHKGIVIDRALTQADYQELGGVIQSLTQRADEEYQALVQENTAYRQVTCQVMLRMVALGGGELARRRVPLLELEYPPDKNDLVKKLIERFSKARLVVEGQDAEGKPYVEPAHDALVRGWEKLQGWLAQEQNLGLQRRLTPSAFEWKAQQQTKFLWNANPYLNVLNQEVLKSPDNNWLNQVEAEFVQSSLRRRRNNLHRLVATVTGVVLSIGGFAVFAGYQWRQSEIGRIEALMQSSKANFKVDRNSFDGLIDALEAEKRLQQLPWGGSAQNLRASILETLAQSVYWVREQNRLQGHQDVIQAIDYSPDGRIFATASYDNTVNLRHSNGSSIASLKGHTKPVMSVSFSPDGQTIASGSQDGTVKLWSLKGKCLRTIPAHEQKIYSVKFSPDGQTIITGSEDTTAKLWNRNGKLVNTIRGHTRALSWASFSPDSNRIVTTSVDGTVKFWRRDGTLQKTLPAHSDVIASADFSPNDQILATASLDKTVKLWSHTGELLHTFEHSNQVWSVRFKHDGQTIVSGSADGSIHLWFRDGSLLDVWSAHNGPIPSLDFSPDGKMLVTVSNDKFAKFWQVDRNWLSVLRGHDSPVNSIQFSPNGKRVVSGGNDAKVKFWSSAGELLSTQREHEYPVKDVSFSPDGRMIASASNDKTVRLWTAKGQLQRILEGHLAPVLSVSFSPDGRMIASASSDLTAKLWRSSDGKELRTLKGHRGRVLSVSFSPDGRTIATTSDDQTVKLWSLEGKELKTMREHTSRVWQVSFSPDSQMIASASADETIKLWNLERNSVIRTLSGHTGALLAVSFSPDGQIIASAGSDRTIKLWQRDGTLITTLRGHQYDVNAVSFSPDGEWLATADFGGAILLWKVSALSLSELIKEGCSQIRNYLKTQSDQLYEFCSK